jgi:hypothetical protein
MDLLERRDYGAQKEEQVDDEEAKRTVLSDSAADIYVNAYQYENRTAREQDCELTSCKNGQSLPNPQFPFLQCLHTT